MKAKKQKRLKQLKEEELFAKKDEERLQSLLKRAQQQEEIGGDDDDDDAAQKKQDIQKKRVAEGKIFKLLEEQEQTEAQIDDPTRQGEPKDTQNKNIKDSIQGNQNDLQPQILNRSRFLVAEEDEEQDDEQKQEREEEKSMQNSDKQNEIVDQNKNSNKVSSRTKKSNQQQERQANNTLKQNEEELIIGNQCHEAGCQDQDSEDDFVVVNSSEEEEGEEEQEEEDQEEEINGHAKKNNQGEEKKKPSSAKASNGTLKSTQKTIKSSKKKLRKSIKKSSWRDNLFIFSILFGLFAILFLQKYFEEQYRKIKHLTSSAGEDLYAVLDIDSGASMREIRSQYRRLVLLWHPDKNPECGKRCEEKFTSIVAAYEILGQEDKRRVYDQTSGTLARIPSRAITLHGGNFESLVMESRDIWIIEVYEDGNNFCEYMAQFFESAVKQYSHIVRFGRINRETARDALQYVPLHVKLLPTIFSYYAPHNDLHESQLYTYDRTNTELSLHRFVAAAIPNNVKIFDEKEAASVLSALTHSQKIAIVMLSSSSKMPTELKYAAYKYHEHIDFYATKYGSLSAIEEVFSLKKGQANFLIYYGDAVTEKQQQAKNTPNQRPRIEIFVQRQEEEKFANIVKLAKFLSVPAVDRSSFSDYCEKGKAQRGQQNAQSESSTDFERQTLCILIESDKFTGGLRQQVHSIQSEIIKKALQRVQKGEPLWKHAEYNSGQEIEGVQFVLYDEKFHTQLKRTLDKAASSSNTDFAAVGLLAENRKVTFLSSIALFEDWVFDALEGGTSATGHFAYLEEFLPPGTDALSRLLKFAWESNALIFGRRAASLLKDWRLFLSSLVGALSLRKFLECDAFKTLKFGLFIYVAIFLALAVFELYLIFSSQ